MELTVKNMVCRHCVECVRDVLGRRFGLPVSSVELGHAIVDCELTPVQIEEIDRELRTEGFELIRSREAGIVDQIKRRLIDAVRNENGSNDCRLPLRELLFGVGRLSYASLSRLFSEVEGRSVENYFVRLRVERVKELIRYSRMTMSEIADATGYSSVAHLSRQFKQVTGLTPTQFAALGSPRTPLPEL